VAAPYTVRWSPGAQRELDALPNDIAERVLRAVARLAQNRRPRPT
jgi:mRNA-degrading endonuclease RelE of RelBE toxin-antitoxin system